MINISKRKCPFPQEQNPEQIAKRAKIASDALFRDTEAENHKPLPKGVKIPESVLAKTDAAPLHQLDRHLQDSQTNLIHILANLIPLKAALLQGRLDKKPMQNLITDSISHTASTVN